MELMLETGIGYAGRLAACNDNGNRKVVTTVT